MLFFQNSLYCNVMKIVNKTKVAQSFSILNKCIQVSHYKIWILVYSLWQRSESGTILIINFIILYLEPPVCFFGRCIVRQMNNDIKYKQHFEVNIWCIIYFVNYSASFLPRIKISYLVTATANMQKHILHISPKRAYIAY